MTFAVCDSNLFPLPHEWRPYYSPPSPARMRQKDRELVIEWAKLVFRCLARIHHSCPVEVVGDYIQVATNGEVSDERVYALYVFSD